MRKIRENLDTYGGLVCMVSVTAPSEAVGLVWDRSLCTHPASERCSGPRSCRVDAGAAAAWNEASKALWRKLNRLAKKRADHRIRRLGARENGGFLLYEWELQKRGVWHLHVVLGMETAIERAWAFEYVKALRELAPGHLFGFVDEKPLRDPQPALRVSSYLSKYLAKWRDDGTLDVSETVQAAGRTLLNYVSRKLTARSGCTMRALRNARVVWAWREGLLPEHRLDEWSFVVAVCLLERLPPPARGP